MFLIENQPIAPLTTFGIGGLARWFVEATTEAEIEEAVEWASSRTIDLFVLGGGSNLLVSDSGFNGLVLKIGLPGLDLIDCGGQSRIISAGAGVSWEDCVNNAIAANCAGIECLAGIPGTVGGTPVQNVGAYGQEVSSVIDRVRAFDRHKRAFVELSVEECNFSYRRSRFNTSDRNRFIVTRVDYRLKRDGAPTIRYADLERALAASHPNGAQPTLEEVAAAVRRVRQSKGMVIVDGDPDSRSAGSFFKNPVVPEELLQKVAACNAPHIVKFDGKMKIRMRQDKDFLKAVLAWSVAGAVEWYQHGLQIPESVQVATAALFAHNDFLSDFLTEMCVVDSEGKGAGKGRLGCVQAVVRGARRRSSPRTDIVVSPPGKKLQNVLLLFEGEKALTALALLVGIFQFRPSPFCVLDEVDAALDETNVGRFSDLLESLSRDTQFLIVTHSKRIHVPMRFSLNHARAEAHLRTDPDAW